MGITNIVKKPQIKQYNKHKHNSQNKYSGS